MRFPDRTLTSMELISRLNHLKEFIGVFSRDRVPSVLSPDHPTSFIVNLDDHQGPGTHWVAVYHNPHDPYVEYFDSFGLPPPLEIQRYKRLKPILYNDGMLQDLHSSACGYYCIYFLQLRSQGVPYAQILKHFREGAGAYNERVITHAEGLIRR